MGGKDFSSGTASRKRKAAACKVTGLSLCWWRREREKKEGQPRAERLLPPLNQQVGPKDLPRVQRGLDARPLKGGSD